MSHIPGHETMHMKACPAQWCPTEQEGCLHSRLHAQSDPMLGSCCSLQLLGEAPEVATTRLPAQVCQNHLHVCVGVLALAAVLLQARHTVHQDLCMNLADERSSVTWPQGHIL